VQKYLSDNLQNKNFKISSCFFSLQGTPVLLVPWMVYIIAFLIANTVLYIFIAERFFAKVLAAIFGYITIIGVVIYLCK